MKNIFLTLSFFFTLTLLEASKLPQSLLESYDYFLCLEGGGSKTCFQVLDAQGNILSLYQDNREVGDLIEASGSNINFIGKEGFSSTLDECLHDLHLGENRLPLASIQDRCLVVGGFSGILSNQTLAEEAFIEKNFKREQLFLLSDADMDLELTQGRGVVLIAGSGSICMGLEQGEQIRAGGFGKLLKDGSGYNMGVCAIRAALEQEYGYGQPTPLTTLIKERFHVQFVRELIKKIHGNELSVAEVASLAKDVFEFAIEGDLVSQNIVHDTAQYLGGLLYHVVRRMDKQSPIDVYLIGGLFRTDYPIMEEILHTPDMRMWQQDGSLHLHDMSAGGITTHIVQERLLRKKIRL